MRDVCGYDDELHKIFRLVIIEEFVAPMETFFHSQTVSAVTAFKSPHGGFG
jgi:hypothetical protein